MKKTIHYLIMLLLATWTITGCGHDDDDKVPKEDPAKNILELDGETYTIRDAAQSFYGHYFSQGSNNIDLVFRTDEYYIHFELHVPNGKTKLVTGTYEPGVLYDSYTISRGYVCNSNSPDEVLQWMTTATVTIKADDDIYTIDVTGTLEDGTTGKGHYSGKLKYYDHSNE
jgi:hypothetical protein